MKKFVVLLIVSMFFTVLPSSAETGIKIWIDEEREVLVIDAGGAAGDFGVYIYNENMETILLIDQLSGGEIHETDMKNLASGEYVVKAAEHAETVVYLNKADAENLIRRISSAADTQECLMIFEGTELFLKQCEQYERYKTFSSSQKLQAASIIMKRTYESIDQLREAFNESVTVASFINASETEIVDVLLQNETCFANIDEYQYFCGAEEESKYEIAKLLVGKEYNDISDIKREFEKAVLLTEINNATNLAELKLLIMNNADVICFDVVSLTQLGSNEMAVFKKIFGRYYDSIEMLRNEIDKAIYEVEEADSPPTSSGGGGGSVDIDILDVQGNVIEEIEYGNPVTIRFRCAYKGESPLVYVAAVYNRDGTLAALMPYESKAAQKNEIELFELNTAAIEGGYIKVFPWNGFAAAQPMRESTEKNFYDYQCVSEPLEEETDGITAVKGNIIETDGKTCKIHIDMRRYFGRWFSEENEITVSCGNVSAETLMVSSGYGEVIYIRNIDSAPMIERIEAGYEIIEFTAGDIVSASADSIIILTENGEKNLSSYNADLYTNYEKNSCFNFREYWLGGEEAVYTASIFENDIMAVHKKYYIYEKVILLNEKYLITENYSFNIENTNFKDECLKVGDVAGIMPQQEKIFAVYRAKAVSGIYTGDNEITAQNGKIYKISNANTYLTGDKVIVYLNFGETAAVYSEPDESAFETVLISGVREGELLTHNGSVLLGEYVIYNDTIVSGSEFMKIISAALPVAAEIDSTSENVKIRELSLLYSGAGEYNGEINSLEAYLIGGETKVFAVGADGIFENPQLVSGMRYQAAVYGNENEPYAKCVVIDDPNGSIGACEKYMAVISCGNGTAAGYTDGVYEEIPCEVTEVKSGDIIKYLKRGEAVKGVTVVMSMSAGAQEQYCGNDSSRITCAGVKNITETGVLQIRYSGGVQNYKIVQDTAFLMYDSETGDISPCAVSDIYYHPLYAELSDYVFIHSEYSLIKTVILYK